MNRPNPPFFAFSRSAFGIVMIRTDGNRLLVYTNSARTTMKEIYAYKMGDDGEVRPDQVIRF